MRCRAISLVFLLTVISCGSDGDDDDDQDATSDSGGSGGDSTPGDDSGGGMNDGSPSSDAPAGSLQWWTQCGDPSCTSMGMDDPAIPNCTTEVEGAACQNEGVVCEIPADGCNADLICATEDPTEPPGSCPKSLRSTKKSIRYLGERDLGRVADELRRLRLATWVYEDDRAAEGRLGFIIDDGVPAPIVNDARDRVDLYGYTSMAVAGFQVQAQEIDALRAEIDLLRRELETIKGSQAVCEP